MTAPLSCRRDSWRPLDCGAGRWRLRVAPAGGRWRLRAVSDSGPPPGPRVAGPRVVVPLAVAVRSLSCARFILYAESLPQYTGASK